MNSIGLRQGDCLSCISWLVYINQLEEYLQSNDVNQAIIGNLYLVILLFADDLCLIDTTAKGLRKKINLLLKFCDELGMQINSSKTTCFY